MGDERDMPDIDYLRTTEEVIAWLRLAGETCSETAKHITDPEQAAYQRGRGHAFGLAARTIEDVARREQG